MNTHDWPENAYAILDSAGGWLVNIVLWDGNPETWSPPDGTTVAPAREVDFDSLPSEPSVNQTQQSDA